MGAADTSPSDSADAFCYEPSRDQWKSLAPLPGARRGTAGIALDDHRLFLIGGCRGDKDTLLMLDEVLMYDMRENRYQPCTPLPFSALCEQAVILNGHIYVIGGEDKPRHRTDRVVVGTLTQGK